MTKNTPKEKENGNVRKLRDKETRKGKEKIKESAGRRENCDNRGTKSTRNRRKWKY